MLGRPDRAAAGELGIVPAGPADAVAQVQPLLEAMGRRIFSGGDNPEAAAAIKIAHNFVLGCAIEVMGEGMSLVRKYGVEPLVLHQVLTEGIFASPAYNGVTLTTQMWVGDDVGAQAGEDDVVLYRVLSQEGASLLDRGRAVFAQEEWR